MSFKVVAVIPLRAGCEDAFLDAFRACAAESRKEAGILQYELWREPAGERRFFFNELYVDEAAVHQHMATEHVRVFGEACKDLFAAEPVVYFGDPVGF